MTNIKQIQNIRYEGKRLNIFKISKSYLSNKNKTGMAKLHSYISVFGIMFGIAALIVVNASMKGFSNYLVEKLNPDFDVIINLNHENDPKNKELFSYLDSHKNVENYSTLNVAPEKYRGGISHYVRNDYYVLTGGNVDIELEPDTIYLPISYYDYFLNHGVNEGKTREEVKKELSNLYLPFEIYAKFSSEIIDQSIFKVEFQDKIKIKGVLMSQQTFDENFFVEGLSPSIPLVALSLKDKIKATEISKKIDSFPSVSKVSNWLENKESFLNSLKIEQLLIKIVLFFIVLVSCFNIVSTMTLIITEKKQDIYLLKTIGYSNIKVLSIFLITGFWYGIIGMIAGTILGLLITFNMYEVFAFFEWLFNIKMIPIGEEGFPYSLLKEDLIIINSCTLFVVLLASLVPAMHTLKMKPAEGLRDE